MSMEVRENNFLIHQQKKRLRNNFLKQGGSAISFIGVPKDRKFENGSCRHDSYSI